MNDLLTMQIDLHQLKENVDTIKEKSQRKIIVVVKSNAYRMGDIEIAAFLEKHGVQYFGVVDMDEAVRLCEAGIKANILIFNSTQVEEFPLLEQYPNLIPSLNTIEDCRLLAAHHFMPIKVHLQVDTGMSRIGFQTPPELVEGLWYIQNKSHITIEGIYSHITMPESLEKQEQRFLKFTGIYPFEMIHLAASCAYKNTKVGNYVRVGLDCYGDGSKSGTPQIVTVRAKPVSVHTVKKGSTVGYNETYVAEKDIQVALLPIGYQNGYRRSMKNFYVLCNGKKYPTIGNICMNHVYVLVDETIDYTSEFIITSPQLPIIELAEKMQTNTHEVLCSFEITNRRYLMGLYD